MRRPCRLPDSAGCGLLVFACARERILLTGTQSTRLRATTPTPKGPYKGMLTLPWRIGISGRVRGSGLLHSLGCSLYERAKGPVTIGY